MLITVGQKSFSPDSVASSKLRHLGTGLGNPKHRPPGQLDDPIYFGLVDCHSVGGATLRGSFPARLASVWVPESHQRCCWQNGKISRSILQLIIEYGGWFGVIGAIFITRPMFSPSQFVTPIQRTFPSFFRSGSTVPPF